MINMGGGATGSPRIVEENGEQVVIIPHTMTVNFEAGDTHEPVLTLNLSVDILFRFDDTERAERIASIKNANALPSDLDEKVRNRLTITVFSILVRLSQDLRITPPITIPGITTS